jgi:hypothetical protein
VLLGALCYVCCRTQLLHKYLANGRCCLCLASPCPCVAKQALTMTCLCGTFCLSLRHKSQRAAEESRDAIVTALTGADMVFVTVSDQHPAV